MAKQKYCRVALNLAIGNRKASVVEPIELEEGVDNTNTFDNELGVLIANFVAAVQALPSFDDGYTFNDVKGAVAEYFNLQEVAE